MVLELGLLVELRVGLGQGGVGVLRGRVDFVDKLWPVLVGAHIVLEGIALGIGLIEVSCEGLGSQWEQ